MDNIFQKLCGFLTNHKCKKFIAKYVGIEAVEYHWKCRICGKRFWNYNDK
jgi:PHP family Zn ribbon phosphoesterase